MLLTRRQQGAHLGGMWEFPGGKLEEGEAPEEALRRECQEECGIEVRARDILEVTFHRYPDKDVLLLFYITDLVAGDVVHRGVADHAWVAADELDDYDLPPADVRILDKVRRLLRAP